MTVTASAERYLRLVDDDLEAGPLVSGPEACRLTGITYRMLDYWVRTGRLRPLRPQSGSGSQRGFRPVDMLALRVCRDLAGLGARSDSIHAAAALVYESPAEAWAARFLMVDADGSARLVHAELEQEAGLAVLAPVLVVPMPGL